MRLGWAALIASVSLLAGCDDEQQAVKQEAIRHCVADVRSMFARHSDPSANYYYRSKEEITTYMEGEVDTCMNKAGFVYSGNRPLCIGDHSDTDCWDVEHPNRPWRFVSHYWHFFRGDTKTKPN
jgi:hypothetical protein